MPPYKKGLKRKAKNIPGGKKVKQRALEKRQVASVVAAANTVAAVAEAGNAVKSLFKKGKTKVGRVTSVSGRLKGKTYGPGKPVNRKIKNDKGLLTKYGLAVNGVSQRQEVRWQDPSTGGNESRVVGHMSLPASLCYYNIFRSLIKFLFNKAGVYVPSLEQAADGMTGGNTAITLSYYNNWTDSGNTMTSVTYNAVGNVTYRTIADGLANKVLEIGADMRDIRWIYVELIPQTGGYSAYSLKRTKLNLASMKFEVKNKSMLKFQNQSGIYPAAGGDAPSDNDVNNIPIECHAYYANGNQFVHQNLRTGIIPETGSNCTFNVSFAPNVNGSEPRPFYEYLNCSGKEKLLLEAGDIKTSIMTYHSTKTFGDYMRLLLKLTTSITQPVQKIMDASYVKALGHTRIFWCDRVIGNMSTEGGRVRLMYEAEIFMQVACNAKTIYVTDQYDNQIDATITAIA